MPLFHPEIYIGAPDSGDYFTSVRPPAAVGRLMAVDIREGQDENRPFQRAVPSQLDAHLVVRSDQRPYAPGQLVIARVAQDDTTEDWFRGVVTQPDYDTPRHGRTQVYIPALGTFDRLRRTVNIGSVSNRSYSAAMGDVLTAVAWPTAAEFRQIPAADFTETLSTWEVDNQEALPSMESILNTAGPPARMLPLRNGGLQVIRDIGTISGAHIFESTDIFNDYDLSFDDRSLINSVTLSGTEYTSSTSSSSEERALPRTFRVLDGLQAGNRAALAERIFDAYEFGLTYLTFTLTIIRPSVYDRARRLRLGAVIAVDLEGERRSGYIASLEWSWRQTMARVRVGMVVKGNIVGVRFPPVFMYGGFKVTEGIHDTGYTPSGFMPPTPNTSATGRPTISGTAQVGETLTAAQGNIADANGLTGTIYAYQWRADNVNIAGETGVTFTPIAADIGARIRVVASFTDDDGYSESRSSLQTVAVIAEDVPITNNPATGSPTIGGTAQVGETLTVSTSGIADADGLSGVAFTFQWLADDVDIAGEAGNTYTPVDADIGEAISVEVNFTDDLGNDESLTSAETAAVIAAGVPPPVTGLNWRFDALDMFNIYFTPPAGLSQGRWEEDPGGSTGSGNTGPAHNNIDPFVHTETSGSQPEDIMETNGLAPATAAANAALNDRDIVIRYAFQTNRADSTGRSLRFQGKATADTAWTTIAALYAWAYSGNRDAGDTVTDANGDVFTVVQDGGWRDVTISTGDYDEYRLAPDYDGDSLAQDIALHSIRSA